MKHVALIFAVLALLGTAVAFVWLTRLAATTDTVIVTGCVLGAVFLAIPARASQAGAAIVALVKGAKGTPPCA